MDFFKALQNKGLVFNNAQKQAISHVNGPLLVAAGPGSGKTCVIAARAAYLIEAAHVDPSSILVITFTRAAANEMRSRFTGIPGITAEHIKKVDFGTFHSICYKILNSYYNRHLQVLESSKGYTVIKNILRSMTEPSDDDVVETAINEISLARTTVENFQDFKPEYFTISKLFEIYKKYEYAKHGLKCIDFDDMIIMCKKILDTDEIALSFYRSRYKYFLIDEFQDTNRIQFDIIKKLCLPENNICVVGDDDQSIYGFRGATPKCMHDFEDCYKTCKIIIMDTNYRSTKSIVEASRRVITFNTDRKDKDLNSVREEGVKPCLVVPDDEEHEASYIADRVQEMVKGGFSYSDFAVLYRVKLQSRPLVDELVRRNIPFNLREGLNNFYTHWICSDITCYLKLSLNINDMQNLSRIVNRPNRYIDSETLKKALSNFKDGKYNILNSFEHTDIKDYQLKNINELIDDLNLIKKMTPLSAVKFIREKTGYQNYVREYCTKSGIEYNDLLFIFDDYQMSASKFSGIEDFLYHIDNISKKLKNNETVYYVKNGITLSTIHSAKGLEFKCVFAAGVVENILPHIKSSLTLQEIEEERRLFYVAVTRAKDILFISAPKKMHGKAIKHSRFFDEIAGKKRNTDESNRLKYKFKVGELIYHRLFGTGKITDINNGIAKVCFSGKSGTKQLDMEACIEKGMLEK